MAANPGAILVGILVTLAGLATALYLERKARALPPLRSPPPWEGIAPGPQGTLVLTLSSASEYKRFRTPLSPDPSSAKGEVASRARSVILVRLHERHRLPTEELLARARQGSLPGLPWDVQSFLAGEPAEKRWRVRARQEYHGSPILFGLWYRIVYTRRMTPPERYLKDLDLVLSALAPAPAPAPEAGALPVHPQETPA